MRITALFALLSGLLACQTPDDPETEPTARTTDPGSVLVEPPTPDMTEADFVAWLVQQYKLESSDELVLTRRGSSQIRGRTFAHYERTHEQIPVASEGFTAYLQNGAVKSA